MMGCYWTRAIAALRRKADLLKWRRQARRWPPSRPHPAAAGPPARWAEPTAWPETRGRNNSSRKPPPSRWQTHRHASVRWPLPGKWDDRLSAATQSPQKGRQGDGWFTDCFGTKSKRMRLSSWSSSSITAARGYMCSMSKWNWTPAGGSRRKFLLSYDHSAQSTTREGASFTPGCTWGGALLPTGRGSAAGWSPPRCSRPREARRHLDGRVTRTNVNNCVQHQGFERTTPSF